MPKEEKPLPYERRVQDTKGRAQRLDLAYLRHPGRLLAFRRQLTLAAAAVSVLAAVPFFLRPAERFYSPGPVSRAHAIFENNCSTCHVTAYAAVGDTACKSCHDGPIHKANAIGAVRCAECHAEHSGRSVLADVDNRQCTRCHADLSPHGVNLQTKALRVTDFRADRHPEFSALAQSDARPLRLNHAIHLPDQPRMFRSHKLPMKCSDCHATDPRSSAGDLVPVTFEQNCRSCHAAELSFDVFQLLGGDAPPAPHTKDPQTIHAFIVKTYQDLYKRDPEVARRSLGRDLEPQPSPAAWLNAVVSQSENFVFQRKCVYCHEYQSVENGYPVVKKVNQIHGRYLAALPAGSPWMPNAVFSHRSHRAVQCESCHQAARKSTKTSDILIPAMRACESCHGATGTRQDNCSECHLYHDKSKELDRDRRPIEQLTADHRQGRKP
jgi:hypothetical protein